MHGVRFVWQSGCQARRSVVGRAPFLLASVQRFTSHRIFCHALDAELLAIAGLYLTSENLAADVPRHYVQAFLDGESLRVEALK